MQPPRVVVESGMEIEKRNYGIFIPGIFLSAWRDGSFLILLY